MTIFFIYSSTYTTTNPSNTLIIFWSSSLTFSTSTSIISVTSMPKNQFQEFMIILDNNLNDKLYNNIKFKMLTFSKNKTSLSIKQNQNKI